MKLNLLKCLKVYQAIQDVENEKMGFSTAHTLIMAKKQLEPHVEFYSAQEKEIVEKCTVVATGGFSSVINPLCKTEFILDENLILNGLLAIYKKNR